MPKTTTSKRQKTNKSSSSRRPISSRTRQGAKNLLTINNSSSICDTTASTIDSRRLVYISCNSWLTIDTYLEPLQSDKKDKKQIKKGDKFMIMNPFSDYNEVQVDSVSPDGTFCNISRMNLNRLHEFQHTKTKEYIKMKYEIIKGKKKINIDDLRNQEFCRRKKTITKIHQYGFHSDELHPKKE